MKAEQITILLQRVVQAARPLLSRAFVPSELFDLDKAIRRYDEAVGNRCNRDVFLPTESGANQYRDTCGNPMPCSVHVDPIDAGTRSAAGHLRSVLPDVSESDEAVVDRLIAEKTRGLSVHHMHRTPTAKEIADAARRASNRCSGPISFALVLFADELDGRTK